MVAGLMRRNLSDEERRSFFSELAQQILHHCRPTRIIVFGSYASGSERLGSDLDVCILFESEAQSHAAQECILSQPPLVGIATDYLFMSEEYFDSRKKIGGVCVEIADKGLTIYQENYK